MRIYQHVPILLHALCATLLAQGPTRQNALKNEPRRISVIAKVVNSKGDPVVGACVEAWCNPSYCGGTYGFDDEVVGSSNDRGVVRLELLQSYPYAIVATWKGDDGPSKHSRIVERCFYDGEPIRLIEAPELGAFTTHIRVIGTPSDIGIVGRLRVRILCNTLNRRVVASGVVEDGRLQLVVPYRGDDFHWIELIDDAGIVDRATSDVSSGISQCYLDCRPGRSWDVVVRDRDGLPIEGAEVRFLSGLMMHRLASSNATTDVMGQATVRSRRSSLQWHWTMLVTADGYEDAFVQSTNENSGNLNGTPFVPREHQGAFPVVMKKANLWAGRVCDARGVGMPGVRVVMRRATQLRCIRGEGTTGWGTMSISTTDSEGRYYFPAIDDATSISLHTCLPPHMLTQRVAENAIPTSPWMILPSIGTDLIRGELPKFDFGSTERRQAHIHGEDAHPVAGVAIVDSLRLLTNYRDMMARAVRTNKHGFAALCVNNAYLKVDSYAVLEGIGWSKLDSQSIGRVSTLCPFERVVIRVVGADDKPLSRIRFGVEKTTLRDYSFPPIADLSSALGLDGYSDHDGMISPWYAVFPKFDFSLRIFSTSSNIKVTVKKSELSEVRTVVLR